MNFRGNSRSKKRIKNSSEMISTVLQAVLLTTIIASVSVRIGKMIAAASFLQAFPKAEYTEEPLGKTKSRLLWWKQLIFGHLVDFGQGSGKT